MTVKGENNFFEDPKLGWYGYVIPFSLNSSIDYTLGDTYAVDHGNGCRFVEKEGVSQ